MQICTKRALSSRQLNNRGFPLIILNINENWTFIKDTDQIPVTIPETAQQINLPHTWNAIDGQDGGNDYFRGTCCYVKNIDKESLPAADRYYLEICGANSSADVYVNGKLAAHHDGGYSTWRVDLTSHLTSHLSNAASSDQIAILVDNAPNDRVYPQVADFTFYGGLYRNVNIIAVSNTHFDLDYFGGTGLQVTPVMDGKNAKVEINGYITNLQENDQIAFRILDADGEVVAQETGSEAVNPAGTVSSPAASNVTTSNVTASNVTTSNVTTSNAVTSFTANFTIPNAHLWHGKKSPYLYTAEALILRGDNEEIVDRVTARFGCRSFQIDPERGFILNGEEYPLRGVSRHQDRLGIGNALLPEHHREDMDLICELGATTIRLAHYQHDQYFYDLCDERGLVIWAEIPYISNHMPGGRENTIQQMKELIVQNYNHPSIVVWGLSNEITMGGTANPDLLENHRILNDLAHKMDSTRLTTMACVTMCSMDDEYVHIPDTVSYNHYFGWYGGDTSMNGPWFDKFHAKYPNEPIGCSEYGCEALNWHTSDPRQGDYTEEYQAYYHEELIRQLYTRKYLWATHVWNMFDFGADARNEGGENGQNHKGLITMDRKYKKDAFYAYKAWLSDEPFVHICGKRYTDRVEDITKVTIYSNLPEVTLYVNSENFSTKTATDHFFYFEVPNAGETKLTARAGDQQDESIIKKVDTFNESYRLKEQGTVLNWFDITERDGYCSLNDKISTITETVRGKLWFAGLLATLLKKMNANKKQKSSKNEAKNKNDIKNETKSTNDKNNANNSNNVNKEADSEKKNSSGGGMSISLNNIGYMLQLVGGFSVLRLTNMIGMIDISFSKEELLKLNHQLNKIKKRG